MSDDSDLLIAAAATAALFTWMGTRRRADSQARRSWRKMAASLASAFGRTWRETPGYVFVQAVRQALRRRK